jgi:hypothetical protein
MVKAFVLYLNMISKAQKATALAVCSEIIFNFFLIRLVGGGVQLGPLGTAATDWPIVPARVIMMMENLVEWRLAGETEILGESQPQRHFVHHKSHLSRPRINKNIKIVLYSINIGLTVYVIYV